MLTRRFTVKTKLTGLALLSIVVMFAGLPLLSWLLHRQMLDEVNERVVDARQSFLTELDDDLADLTLASRILAEDERTQRALETHDAARAQKTAQILASIYPSLDVLLFDTNGLIGQVGCDSPVKQLAQLDGNGKIVAGGYRGVLAHGCEALATAPPAMVLTLPIFAPASGGNGGAAPVRVGTVVACMPLDDQYLHNAATKLNIHLAFAIDGARISKSFHFPIGAVAAVGGGSTLAHIDGRTWALGQFDVPALSMSGGHAIHVVSALDVTDVEHIIEHNLAMALAVLVVAALASVLLGLRLARVMSHALSRLNAALSKIGRQEYVHVEPISTGDELETLATGFNAMVDGLKERDHLKNTMGKYMTASVLDHLLAGRVALGGETLTVTILFTDIRSFTSLSEKMKAQELVTLLNEYLTDMVTIVMDGGGVVDKYIGDAIMAVFGAPVPTPNDAVNAVTAAVRMRQALERLNVRLAARGTAPLRTGIGIHTGEVVAGNIGSERRMEYTVIGDAVNLASRLETSTKVVGADVLISEDTWERVKDAVNAEPMKELTVKGRNQPVMTYQVLGLKGEPPVDSLAGVEPQK